MPDIPSMNVRTKPAIDVASAEGKRPVAVATVPERRGQYIRPRKAGPGDADRVLTTIAVCGGWFPAAEPPTVPPTGTASRTAARVPPEPNHSRWTLAKETMALVYGAMLDHIVRARLATSVPNADGIGVDGAAP